MTFKIKVEAKIGPSLVVLIWCFSEIILKKFWVYETGEGREKKKCLRNISWGLLLAYDKIEEKGRVMLKDTPSSKIQWSGR